MSLTSKHPALRWWAPVAVVAVVAGTALVATTAGASVGAASLPEISVEQLVNDVQHADVAGVSGTVVQSADLGLPSLPDLGSGTGQLTDLVTGTHTLRVWFGGKDKQRVALLSSGGESDIIHSGNDLWLWDSNDNSATHYVLPSREGHSPKAPSSMVTTSPPQAAQAALGMLTKSTTVTVSNDAVVAGRPAYELTLAPKQPGSLIKAVRIAVDGATYVPLRVQVDSVKTTSPALSIGFTSVEFGAPDPAQFEFTPPPGATVKQGHASDMSGPSGMPGGLPQLSSPTVVGSGWTSVLVAKAAPGTVESAPSPLGRVVAELPKVSGSWGSGRILEGTLFTAVITQDGTVALGATTPALVYSALGRR